MNREAPSSAIVSLLMELRDETTTLLKQEIALAKVEINEKANRLGKNVLELSTGGALVYAGSIVVLIGLGQFVGIGLEALGASPMVAFGLGLLLVGIVVGSVGWSLFAKARRVLSSDNIFPTEAVVSLRERAGEVKDEIQHIANESA